MKIERKLYTEEQVRNLIITAVDELHTAIFAVDTVHKTDKSTIVEQWSDELLPSVEQAVAEEVARRHVQGITLSVWAGPPGSGKGTNIKVMNLLGKLYSEYVSQGYEARFGEPLNQKLLNYSLSKALILTGTGGMFNKPADEYRYLFAKLDDITADFVAHGGFAGDKIVSPLVELMILYRLVQNKHNLQIDLWPRTVPQFEAYQHLIEVVRKRGGKVYEEFVNIRILPENLLSEIRMNPGIYSEKSIYIGANIRSFVGTSDYCSCVRNSESINSPTDRYEIEYVKLEELFSELDQKDNDSVSKVIISELKTICDRMAFRFQKKIEKGVTPRPDGYPLSWIKRLMVYTEETSPAFLGALANKDDNIDISLISTYLTPEKVISNMLDEFFGEQVDPRWNALKKFAGEISISYVNRNDLIEERLLETLGGILRSE